MTVEVLYFQGCPNHRPAVDRVREILREEGISADVGEVEVPDAATAQSLGFLGSPSIRINGLDIEPAARSASEFGMMCRTYTEGGTRTGLPSRELIRRAAREALGGGTHACCTTEVEPRNHAAPSVTRSWLLGGSVVAALAASLCCILPIVAGSAGLAALSAAAIFERWRPYLLAVTAGLFMIGAALAWRDREKFCVPGSLCATKPMKRWNLLALGVLGVLVAGLAAFPYYSATVAAAANHRPPASGAALITATTSFGIAGMNCPSCAAGLQATFRRLPGVVTATVDYDARRATVTYDPAKQAPEAFKQLVRQAGYEPR